MLTIAVKFAFIITIVKNFHVTLPDFVDSILKLLPTNKFEWQFAEGPLSLDLTLGPVGTTTPAPGSKEVTAVPTGTVVPVPATDTSDTVDGDTMDSDPSNPGGPVI